MSCIGCIVTPIIVDGVVTSWTCVEVEIDDTGCEECCAPPSPTLTLEADFPTFECAEGCHLHQRGDPLLQLPVHVWCCSHA